jgi:hypothetical protein
MNIEKEKIISIINSNEINISEGLYLIKCYVFEKRNIEIVVNETNVLHFYMNLFSYMYFFAEAYYKQKYKNG